MENGGRHFALIIGRVKIFVNHLHLLLPSRRATVQGDLGSSELEADKAVQSPVNVWLPILVRDMKDRQGVSSLL